MFKYLKHFRKFLKILSTLLMVTVIVLLVSFIQHKTNFTNRANYTILGKNANITIDFNNSYKLDGSWNYFAQGGEEKIGGLSKVITKVKLLNPKYIRIDHVFDFYEPVRRDPTGKIIYDWSRLDAEIADILATGAKPFISLSYMPRAISTNTEVDIPSSWPNWQEIVKATIEHISGTKGLSIENVYYEVWNEPDIFGNFKLSGEKNYLTLYYYAALGAQSTSDVLAFKLGGPATTTLSRDWFYTFYKFTQERGLRLDFYSWHRYSKYISDYEKDIEDVQKWFLTLGKPIDIEFIITETGFSPENDKNYDSEFSAIHTLALYLATFQKNAKLFLFELKDGPSDKQFWGRWGLLTNEKFGEPIEKPRYKAIEFLNAMSGVWFPVYGQGTWVRSMATKDASDVINILLVNYDPYEKHWERVPLNFYNLPSGSYQVKKINFLGEKEEYAIEVADNTYKSELVMRPNSGAILEFTRKISGL